MSSIHDNYIKLYSKLRQYKAEVERYESAIAVEKENYRKAVQLANEKMEFISQENASQVSRAKALISIAETHTTKHIIGEARPYNNSTLSKLAVQVSSGVVDDPYATMLYTEATGQLKYLQMQQKQLDQLLEKAIAKIGADAHTRYSPLLQELDAIKANAKELLHSADMQELIASLKKDRRVYNSVENISPDVDCTDIISIGSICVPFPVIKGLEDDIDEATKGFCDLQAQTLLLPAEIDITYGNVMYVEYDNVTEETTLSGIQNLIFNIAKHHSEEFVQVVMVDPSRFNISSLGILAPLSAGRNAFIDPVPTSKEDMSKKIEAIITDLNLREAKAANSGMPLKKTLLVFHNFPQEYSPQTTFLVQQLCLTSKHFNSLVLVTNNTSVRTYDGNNTLSFIRNNSLKIDKTFFDSRFTGAFPFSWYAIPSTLPPYMIRTLVEEPSAINISNNYEERVGFQSSYANAKGTRNLTKIPYGIDEDGSIQYLDFENSNFATFICGAARSGKSTLLHTLITGFLENNHPDDVEIWLVDFKMTEFSRYISHMPPHIRYIVLDESPELVYDILDRLTDILIKRQNIFKGKWQKLSEVPPEKYMPAILVIIDEFSVMSQIISESALSGKENYMVKLQMLLAKGAALGLHFIFASQGFTSGTRGLNDFSKKQVQQRIAMKTEYSEIKETLDLRSATDADKAAMEQLPVHYALTRISPNEKGDHLRLAQVLYIPNYEAQERMIDDMCRKITSAPKYDFADAGKYICKQPMIVDGNSYVSFNRKLDDIRNYLARNNREMDDELLLFIGEPRRLIDYYPIYVTKEFCENILLIASYSENGPACATIASMMKSFMIQGQSGEVWSPKRNPFLKTVSECDIALNNAYTNIEDICSRIRSIRARIERKEEATSLIFIFGYEAIVNDLKFAEKSTPAYAGEHHSNKTISKRAENMPDLNTLLAALNAGKEIPVPSSAPSAVSKIYSRESGDSLTLYDARDDLKYILTSGPRYGYHFVLAFGSVMELTQSKADTSLFKHKIMFRSAKTDANVIMGASNGAVVSELQDHSFRYTNGMDSISFRPYLHPGISWDGWTINSNGQVTNEANDEEEYLL